MIRHRSHTPSDIGHDSKRDRGSSLVVTIGFVVMVGSIVAGLAALATSSINNRNTLGELRDRQYAADSAIEVAIAQVRASGQSTSTSCSGGGGKLVSDLNGYSIRVDWQNACTVVRGSDGFALVQRNVIFAACDDRGVTCVDSTVIVRAQVNFEQGLGGQVTRTYVQSWSVNQ